MKKSLHILADLYDCSSPPQYFTSRTKVRAKTLAMIKKAGFKIVASRFHKFSPTSAGAGGVTGVVIVSESHIAIHTWPERKFVNLDIFFCNSTRDNTTKVRTVFKEFEKIYHSEKTRRREIRRD